MILQNIEPIFGPGKVTVTSVILLYGVFVGCPCPKDFYRAGTTTLGMPVPMFTSMFPYEILRVLSCLGSKYDVVF